jgi:hypothetical protein
MKKDKIGGACNTHMRNAYNIMDGNIEGKGPLERLDLMLRIVDLL